MENKVLFKQGLSVNLTQALVEANVNTAFVATDKPVFGIGGQLYYGQPTIKYTNDKIVMYGISGDTSVVLGEVDLTLDSFLEGAKFIPGSSSAVTEAYNFAKSVNSGITEEQVEDAYDDAFGTDYSGDTSAIVMVMHTEKSSGDTHTVVVLPIGKIIGDSQVEIDNIEEAVGLNNDGTKIMSTGNYTSAETTVEDEIAALDEQVKINEDDIRRIKVTSFTVNDVDGEVTSGESGTTLDVTINGDDIKVASAYTEIEYSEPFSGKTISSGDTVAEAFGKVEATIAELVDEVLDDEAVEAAAIKALALAAGTVDADNKIAYVPNEDANYIFSATSLADADDILDAAIAALGSGSTDLIYELSAKTVTVITVADNSKDILSATSAVSEDGTISYELSVDLRPVEGVEAIVVTSGSSADTISLLIDATEDDAVELTQSEDGLKATLNIDNSLVTEENGGVKLTNATSGLSATFLWGTF